MSEPLSWSEQRRANARIQAERLAERKAAESAKAQRFLDQFVQAAKEAGLPAEPLMVVSPRGGRAKTGLTGWVIKADGGAAVDVDGRFYLLERDLSFWDKLRSVQVKPSEPPLVLGAGGRDGESIDLEEALSKVLPTWRSA